MNGLIKAIALLGVVSLTGCGTATVYDKANIAAIKQITVEQPDDPSGVVPSIDAHIAALATGEPTPERSTLNALVGGLGQKIGDNIVKSDAKKFPQPNRNSFLVNRGVRMGSLLADDMRSALAAEGYVVVAGTDPADAVVSLEFVELGYRVGPDEKWYPYLKVKVSMKSTRTKSTLFQRTYHYAEGAQSMWDEGIDPDPQYSGDSATMFANDEKLLFESLRAGVEKSVAHAALALKPS
jgi:hypothetical protein